MTDIRLTSGATGEIVRVGTPAIILCLLLTFAPTADAQDAVEAAPDIVVTGRPLTQAQCAAVGRGEDPASHAASSDPQPRISWDDCIKLNRVERACVDRVSTRRNGMRESLARSVGGKAARRWRARMLVKCLEEGAAESELQVTFSGVEEYADEYVERIIDGSGDTAGVPR